MLLFALLFLYIFFIIAFAQGGLLLFLAVSAVIGAVFLSWYIWRDEGSFAAVQKGDWETARKGLSRLARKGNQRAQYLLALMYRNGDGVPQDQTEAARLLTPLAQSGHAEAQCLLGEMYLNGSGVARDLWMAQELVSRAIGSCDLTIERTAWAKATLQDIIAQQTSDTRQS